MHQISCARFLFSPRSLNSIGFGWVCKSFHGNIAPTVLPRCFGGFIVDAPISTVLSVTSNPFWWLRHLFLHFWNLVWFAAVPTGKHPLLFQCFGGFIVGACISAISVLDLQSLLGCCIPWVLVGPAFVPTGMEHQFLQFFDGFVYRISYFSILLRDHVFYGNATSIPVVSWWIYCRFSFFYIFGKTCSAFWGLRHLFLHFWVLVGFASLSMAI